jgi:hypothetical protein
MKHFYSWEIEVSKEIWQLNLQYLVDLKLYTYTRIMSPHSKIDDSFLYQIVVEKYYATFPITVMYHFCLYRTPSFHFFILHWK